MSEELLKQAIAKIDTARAQDPNLMKIDDQQRPVAVVYAEKRSAWVEKLAGKTASEELQIAARAQHIRRCEIPHDSYPRDRIGYLKWCTDLQQFHAAKTAEIMQEVGYGEVA